MRRPCAIAALVITLPSEGDVAGEIGQAIDPDAIFAARQELRRSLGRHLAPRLDALRAQLADGPGTPFSPDAASAGRRALSNAALDLIAAADAERGSSLARRQLASATNMTERLAGLATIALIPGPAREEALAAFAERYRDEPLVLDKWFAIQATIPEPGTLDRIRTLQSHPAFSMTNPNRVRSLIGIFSMMNPTQFNRVDGQGYRLVAETALHLDARNPQIAARLMTAFGSWRLLEPGRRAQAESILREVALQNSLSRDVSDIVARTLAP